MLHELSILIVTWNGDDLLRNCLSSLRKIYKESPPEIIIVDNAASSATRELVAGYVNCRYLSSRQNLGFAGGNNLGLKACTRKYVALLNNDTIVHKDPFTPLMTYLRKNKQVGVVQGSLKLVSPEGMSDTCGTLMTRIGKLHLRHFLEPLSEVDPRPAIVFSVKGAFMVFERNLVEAVGGVLFHDHFFNNYEETDFCHRVWLSGREVHFVPTPPIDHLYNATIARLPTLDVRARELSNMLFSMHSLLGIGGLIGILPFFYLYRLLMIARQACCGSLEYYHIFCRAVQMLLARRKELAIERRKMQSLRVLSDHALFARVMYHPPHGYWLSIFKAWLSGRF